MSSIQPYDKHEQDEEEIQLNGKSNPLFPLQGRTATPPSLSVPVLKISLYEYILRQLQDDGFVEAAEHLSHKLHIKPHIGAHRDSLFRMYERALFDPVLLQQWLLQQQSSPNVTSLESISDTVLSPLMVASKKWQKANSHTVQRDTNESRKRQRISEGLEIIPSSQLHKKQLSNITIAPDGESELKSESISIDSIQSQLEYHYRLQQAPWTIEWTPIKLQHNKLTENALNFHRPLYITTAPENLGIAASQPAIEIIESLNEGFSMDVSGVVSEKRVAEPMVAKKSSKSDSPATTMPRVSERWATAHKGVCSALAIGSGGRLAASGGADEAVRVVVTREDAKFESHAMEDSKNVSGFPSGLRIWTRVFQDHSSAITSLAFNSNNTLLFSGSVDCTVRVYEISKHKYRRASHTLRDREPIICLYVHPSDTMLYCGTAHNIIRCYDIRTLQCYSAINPNEHHSASVTDICTSSDASTLFSSSKDGSVRIWDASANRLVNRMALCHSGMEVNSICISRNQRYLMSAGSDGKARIWDLRKGQELQRLTLSSQPVASIGKCKAVFLSDDHYVASIAESSECRDVVLHDAYSGHILGEFKHHPGRVLNIEPSLESMHLLTACEDFRCRYLSLSTDNQFETSSSNPTFEEFNVDL